MKKLTVVVIALAVFVLAGCGEGAEESAKSDSESAAAECPQADTADFTAITQERADMLLGFTESAAESCALSLGWVFRVGERYGESFVVAEDYSLQRVTVSGSVRSRPVTRVPIYKSLLMDRSGRANPHPRFD